MLESNSKKINELNVRVNEWNVPKATRWLHRLQKVLGPTIGALITSNGEANLREAFTALNSQLGEEQYWEWINELLEGVVVDDKPVNKDSINSIFKGRLLLMHKVIFFVLEVNFKDFLDEFKNKNPLEKLTAKVLPFKQG